MLRFIGSAAVALSCLVPAMAWSQDEPPQDWAVAHRPEHDAVIAALEFTTGLSLVARCQNGVYDLILNGLPEAPANKPTRDLAIQVGDDGELKTTVWTVGTQRTTAFSRIPAMVARDLAEGGKLQILVPSEREGGPRTRYVMNIEPSGAAIETTLTACGRPLIDLRQVRAEEIEGNGQDGLPPAVAWQTMPRPTFPDSVNGRSPRLGYVVLSCVAEESGRLTECQIESEQPPGYNLGKAVERSLPRARLRLTEEGAASGHPLAGRMIVFSSIFRMAS